MLLKKSHKIISLEINAVNYHSTIKRIIDLSQSNTSDYICLANVHMSIEAHWEPKFAEVVNNAKLVTPDGMPLVKAMRLLYGVKQERVAGMDLLPDLLKEAEKQDLSVFFLNGISFVSTNHSSVTNECIVRHFNGHAFSRNG